MKYFVILFVSVFLLFASCTNDPSNRTISTSSSGQPFEILIVINDSKQQSDLIKAFSDILQIDYPGLPQPEAWFNLRFIEANRLTNLHKRQSTIIFTGANEDNDKTFNFINNLFGEEIISKVLEHPSRFYYSARNVWARPQLVMGFFDHNYESLIKKINENDEFLLEQLNHIEHLRQLEVIFKTGEKTKINEAFLNKYNYSIRVPVHFEPRLEINKYTVKDPHNRDSLLNYLNIEHVIWLRGDTRNALNNILMFSFPYKNQNDFRIENILAKRDLIGKYFVPGPSEGSYLITEYLYPPITKETDLNGYYAIETRGLWKIENDFMGGPFINYTIYDAPNNRVIVLDGFVHAPETHKRNFIKRIEVILNTFFTGNESIATGK